MNGGLVGDAGRKPGAVSRWGDLGRRALSAVVLAPVALGLIWIGGAPFDALMAATAVVLSAEWTRLCGTRIGAVPGASMLGIVMVAGALTVAGLPLSGVLVLVAGAASLRIAFGRMLLAVGVLYVGLALVALLWLRAGGRADLLFLIFVVWASDIGAYMTGRLLRGPKLWPALSPAKTWSGAVGGLGMAVVVGEIVGALPLVPTALLAVLLAILCQIGDLLESAVKRHVGVKDSGRLIPGHGGLLDRLDGLLAASPVAALAVLAGWGGSFWR